jgi:membrane-bound lytic murein transglycosylase F
MKPCLKRLVFPKRVLAGLLLAPLLLTACGKDRALERILATGSITVITRNNANCYYTYREQRMGFEYDLAKAFADFLEVELKVTTAGPTRQLFRSLDNGSADVAAAGITITSPKSQLVDFSSGYLPVEQMVIVPRENTRIKNVRDLAGTTIHVRRGAGYEDTLKRLVREGLDLKIKTVGNLTEEIIQAVAEGQIEATVADSHIALLSRRYYPDVRIAFSIGQPRDLGWAVKKGEKALLEKINEFFKIIKQNGTFDTIYNRYYAFIERFDHFDIKNFFDRIETRLPQYEKPIKKAAKQYNFDWRLIAALVYQESQFNPWAKSFSGVRGLMQLTEATAEEMGVNNRLNPDESIMGGVRYLRQLHDLYDSASEPDRTLIALAAYNVGKGHIIDARELAGKKHLDPNKWSSLEKTLPLLERPEYQAQIRFGYCRGGEPVFHVKNIWTYYDILRRGAIQYVNEDGA